MDQLEKVSGNSIGMRTATGDRGVVIIGGNSLQNTLLVNLIEAQAGCACLVRPLNDLDGLPFAANALTLLDVGNVAVAEISSHLQTISANTACRHIAVFNADEDMAFDQIVSSPRIRGVFYRESTQDNLIKGIRAIFDGEYWLPRKILCAHLERTRGLLRPATPEAATLTKKEIETLKLLADGNSTDRIAHHLNVTRHTVKTHIYNLFRKIRVSNRVQAVNWALQNIDGIEQRERR